MWLQGQRNCSRKKLIRFWSLESWKVSFKVLRSFSRLLHKATWIHLHRVWLLNFNLRMMRCLEFSEGEFQLKMVSIRRSRFRFLTGLYDWLPMRTHLHSHLWAMNDLHHKLFAEFYRILLLQRHTKIYERIFQNQFLSLQDLGDGHIDLCRSNPKSKAFLFH